MSAAGGEHSACVRSLLYLITETLFVAVCWDTQTVGASVHAET